MINLTSYPDLQSCSKRINASSFCIKDTSTTCVICNEQEAQLHVVNPSNVDVEFLKIDGCVYPSNIDKRCDCGLITLEKLYLIEFKEIKNFANKKSKARSRKAAKKQLITTINNFKVYGIDLTNTFAIVAQTPMLPHSHKEIVGAGKQSEIATFLSKTGCPNLYYGNLLEIM